MVRNIIYFLIVFSFFLVGCATGPQEKRNAELIVEYHGVEVHRAGSEYSSLKEFEGLMGKKEQKYILFGAKWCNACRFLDKALEQSGHDTTVTKLNSDEAWVQSLMRGGGIRSIPTMVVLDEKDQLVGVFIGPSKIIMHLIVHGPNK